MRIEGLLVLVLLFGPPVYACARASAQGHAHVEVHPLCAEEVVDQNKLADKIDELDDKLDALRIEMSTKYAPAGWVRGQQAKQDKQDAEIRKITEMQASQLSYVRGGIAVLFVLMLIMGGVMPVASNWLGKRREKKKNAVDGG